MPRYASLSMPKAHAVALLGLARFAERQLDRPVTPEERQALASLEYALEGKDRRAVNRFTSAPKPRVDLDLRRRPRTS